MFQENNSTSGVSELCFSLQRCATCPKNLILLKFIVFDHGVCCGFFCTFLSTYPVSFNVFQVNFLHIYISSVLQSHFLLLYIFEFFLHLWRDFGLLEFYRNSFFNVFNNMYSCGCHGYQSLIMLTLAFRIETLTFKYWQSCSE
jgi:hypothetical protein